MRCSLQSPSGRVARSPPLGALSGSACSPHADRKRRGQWHGWAVLPRCRVRSCAGGGECVCGVTPITEPCGRPRAHFRRRRPRHEHRRECVAIATASVIASAAVHRCHRARRAASPRACEPRAIVTTPRRTPAAPGRSNASTQRAKKKCAQRERAGVSGGGPGAARRFARWGRGAAAVAAPGAVRGGCGTRPLDAGSLSFPRRPQQCVPLSWSLLLLPPSFHQLHSSFRSFVPEHK